MKTPKYRKYFLAIGFIFLMVFVVSQRQESEPIENLAVHSGVGYDAKKTVDGEIEYNVPVSVYLISSEGTVTSKIYSGKATNLPGTREPRQRKLDRRFIVGFEKVYMLGENAARLGIRPIVDILMKSQWVNDNGYALVCKGKAEDLMEVKVEGYPSIADYLEGMIYSSKSHDFFTREYSIISLIQTIDAEGKKPALPYIEINKEGQPEITGMAVFNEDRMVMKLDIQDMRMMNIMRNTKVYGILKLEKNSMEYAGFETNVKRKVDCSKEGDRFKFVINLTLNGNVISNVLYPGMLSSPEVEKDFEDNLSKEVKAKCENFIGKMQNEYKMDIINLSEIAIAKYGRHIGVDWDEAVSKADIEVNVKVKVDQHLRGGYYY